MTEIELGKRIIEAREETLKKLVKNGNLPTDSELGAEIKTAVLSSIIKPQD